MNWKNKNLKISKLLSEEPFYDEYQDTLLELNKIIDQSGEPLEGNIFYDHHQSNLEHLCSKYNHKRTTLAIVANTFNNILEIGFNAGHSALLMLTANKDLHLTCVDLCEHSYTKPCFDILKNKFENRIQLIESHSLSSFPLLENKIKTIDMFIIDGGHSVEIAENDLLNVLAHGTKGSAILFDDAHVPELRLLLDIYLMSGKITLISDQLGFIKNTDQMIFLNNYE